MDRAAATLAAAARAQLTAALSALPPGPKRLYVDDDLYCAATASAPLLSAFSATLPDVHPLSRAPAAPPLPNASAVFLLRPSAAAARRAAAAIAAAPDPARALVLVTPRRSGVVERVLARAAGARVVRVAALPLGFLPFDDGVVSLHWPRAFAQVVLEGNSAVILAAAAALRALADALDVDFATVRTAGAAGAATAAALLDLTGRRVHGADAALYRTSSTASAGSAASAGEERDELRQPGDGGRDDPGASGSSLPRFAGAVSADRSSGFLLGSEVTVARVRAGLHLDGRATGKTAEGGGGIGGAAAARYKRPVTLVIIDRNVDMVTPLLTQWTYEGLLDEAVGLLRGNVMDVGTDEFKSEDAASMLCAETVATQTAPSKRPATGRRVQKRLRAEGDAIFGQLRDLNYWAAARLLGSVASSVQAYYDARPGRETAEIGQVKDYVRGLREVKSEHRSAAVHTAIAAEISARTFEQAAFKRRFELEREMLDGASASGRRVLLHDAIARNEPLPHVLRLLCLWSLTGGGVDAESFEFLRREIVATYGLSQLPLLGSLERAGLLARSARIQTAGNMPWNPFVNFGFSGGGNKNDGDATASGYADKPAGGDSASKATSPPASQSVVGYSWQFVRAAMHLMSDFEPEAVSSSGVVGPYSGYVPLSVRLVEAGVHAKGWAKLPRIAAHTLLLPPGHAVGELSVAKGTIARAENTEATSPSPRDVELDDVDAVVLFVGGISRAEASAVRAAVREAGKRVLIATTDVCGANQFVTMT